MTQAWYQVASLLYGYVSAAIIVVFALLALRKIVSDKRLWQRVKKNLPRVGASGALVVLSAGSRRLPAGMEIAVPYEGTLGSTHSCDVCIPVRKVHMRSAFFWMEKGELHMVALHRDGFLVDDVPVEPGDEAVLGDGAVLRIGDTKLVWRLGQVGTRQTPNIGPYVTTARKSKAQQGRGDGLGAPGRSEARREKKLREKQSDGQKKRRGAYDTKDDAGQTAKKNARKNVRNDEEKAEVTAWPEGKKRTQRSQSGQQPSAKSTKKRPEEEPKPRNTKSGRTSARKRSD